MVVGQLREIYIKKELMGQTEIILGQVLKLILK